EDLLDGGAQLVGRLCVGDGDVGPARGQVAHHVQTLGTQPRHGHPLVTEVEIAQPVEVHPFTSRARITPTTAPRSPINQKRCTTCTSLQPSFSKWWCRGAMR